MPIGFKHAFGYFTYRIPAITQKTAKKHCIFNPYCETLLVRNRELVILPSQRTMNKGFFTFKRASALLRTIARLLVLKIAYRNSSFLCNSTLKKVIKRYFLYGLLFSPYIVQQPFSLFSHPKDDE